ncbi:hypothetical protein [[Mycobacterium] nativiensis]|uniref:Uncharacterized protein n=1 Tax=[Mycobacterium] nativiensis TaxID=2855503 RepID=A0ABU5XUW2_9MYCO|nr:hypothetical protein [Mycolicibacter sp. MYC340]MEB3031755.1 hypothetical protein [Mycolicibacter sp. MYC340]
MTKDRKRKRIARALTASSSITYFEARQATRGKPSRSRLTNALTTLAADDSSVIEEWLRFSGHREVTGPLVNGLLAALLTNLNQVPSRRSWLADDLYTAVAGLIDPDKADPPIPAASRSVSLFIEAAVDELDDTTLATAATDIGIRNSEIRAAASVLYRRALAAERDSTGPMGFINSSEEDAGWAALTNAVHDSLARLHDRSGTRWQPLDRRVLQRALAIRLAILGDNYLTVSEHPVRPLMTWERQPDGSLRVDLPIPDGPNPLSGLVQVARHHQADHTSEPEFYSPERRGSTLSYTCYVGVYGTEADDFDRFDLAGHLPSELYGRFQATCILRRIASNPCGARSHSGRLLIPRTNADPADKTVTLDLAGILAAVASESSRADGDQAALWFDHPHLATNGALNSVVGLAMDDNALPWPKPTDLANTAPVDSAVFTDYLVAQGVRFTGMASEYLAGCSAAGPGGQSLSDRHRAGMMQVLKTHNLRAVAAELSSRYPASPQWPLLASDPAAARAHLTDLRRMPSVLDGFA